MLAPHSEASLKHLAPTSTSSSIDWVTSPVLAIVAVKRLPPKSIRWYKLMAMSYFFAIARTQRAQLPPTAKSAVDALREKIH